MKRGQVTAFIIAGVIILIAVVLVLVSQSEYIKDFFDVQRSKLVGVASEVEPVKEYIEGCLKDVGEDAVTLVMLQGGYLSPDLNPGIFKEYSKIDISYWYYDKKDISPNIEDIKNEIAVYVDEILPTCIDSFAFEYGLTEYILEYDELETTINTKGEEIIFNTKIKLDITYKENNFRIDNIIASVERDSIDVFNSAKLLFEDLMLSDNNLNLNKDYKYDINFFYGEVGTIYSVHSNNTMVNFAVNFPIGEEEL